MTGVITDPRNLGLESIRIVLPERFGIDDSMIYAPAAVPEEVEVIKGPTINYVGTKSRWKTRLQRKGLAQRRGQHHNRTHYAGRGQNLPLRRTIPSYLQRVGT